MTTQLELPPPSASRGDLAMQSRIAERLFGAEPDVQFIAHYAIVRRVGVGGMGVVYAARDTKLDRLVALKLVRRSTMSVDGRERLVQEARTLAKLSHPNVVQVYETGEHEGDVYVAMEFVEGETLREWQRKERSARQILRVYLEAGRGLATAHEAGVVHRDFKPANVLVGRDDRVRVADFGLAVEAPNLVKTTTADSDPSVTSVAGQVAGTPGYMAPEVQEGKRGDALSDQFAFCVALWEAFTKARPDPAGTSQWSGPRWLAPVLRRGLSPNPDQRWPSLPALLRELESRPLRRRNRALVGVAVLALAGLTPLISRSLSSDAPNLCEDPSPRINAVWSSDARERLHERLRRTDLPDSGRTVTTVALAYDQFAQRWITAHERACTSTYKFGSRSEEQFDLSNECLDRTLSKAAALLETLGTGDLTVHVHLRELMAELDDPGRCVQTSEVRATPTAQASLGPEVAEGLRSLDHARIDLAAGRLDQAQARLDELAQRPVIDKFEALQAEVWVEQGRLLARRHEFAKATDVLVDAAALAERLGWAKLLFLARREIVAIKVGHAEDERAARHWLTLAEVPASAQADADSSVLVELLEARAEIEALGGQLDLAETTLERALALARSKGDRFRVQNLRLRHANVVATAGRTGEALAEYLELRSQWREELGESHPALGSLEFNFGLAMRDIGDLSVAKQHFEQALPIQEATLGVDSPQLAPILTVLADIANEEQNHELAIEFATRAWRLQAQLPRGHSERGTPLMALGWAQVQTGEFAEALDTHELMLRELDEQLSGTNLAYLHQTIGWLRCRVRACEGATLHYEYALVNGDEITRAKARLGHANVHLAEGRPGEAVALIRAVLPELEAMPLTDAPESLALARWMLARALIDSGAAAASPRVQELAAAALERYLELAPRPDIVADLRLILGDH